jgi:hypothetical protein
MNPTERGNPTDCLAERRAQILAAVDAAEAALARGEGRVITRESMRNLSAEIKQRGRARFALVRAAALAPYGAGGDSSEV